MKKSIRSWDLFQTQDTNFLFMSVRIKSYRKTLRIMLPKEKKALAENMCGCLEWNPGSQNLKAITQPLHHPHCPDNSTYSSCQ